jgi:tRNA1Val (adenine37-N6)-methyltransferase
MKVGTDGVLLGAWADCANAEHILDIGCGTGLLSLMCAQRANAEIIAIEIDEKAAKQAIANVASSPFRQRIQIVNQSLQDYLKSNERKFDYIICNPPFFQRNEKVKTDGRKLARQQISLTYEEVISAFVTLLKPHGSASLIFPFTDWNELFNLVNNYELFLSKVTFVHPRIDKPCKRVLVEITKIDNPVFVSRLNIENTERHIYSAEFKNLTDEFYL